MKPFLLERLENYDERMRIKKKLDKDYLLDEKALFAEILFKEEKNV
jgi:hypothetical protein